MHARRLRPCAAPATVRPTSRRRPRPCPVPPLAATPTDATVLTLLAAAGAAGAAAQRTRIGSMLSSPLIAMLVGGAGAFVGVLPSAHSLYGALWTAGLPVAACLALLEGGVRDGDGKRRGAALSPAATAITPAFLVAASASVAATLAAWRLVGGAARLGAHGWQLAGALAASYVGGSVNLAATAVSIGLPAGGGHLTAALAADNVAMAAYFVALAAVPAGGGEAGEGFVPGPSPTATPVSLLTSIATAAACVALGTAAATTLHAPAWSLAAAAALASGVAACVSPASLFAGADAVSTAVMSLFFAAAGAQAGSRGALAAAAPLAGFVSTLLALQLVLTLGLGRGLLRLDTRAVVIAANAAVGGPATAAAFAAARGWGDLVRPAVLVGCAGYGVGTAVGVGVATVLRGWG